MIGLYGTHGRRMQLLGSGGHVQHTLEQSLALATHDDNMPVLYNSFGCTHAGLLQTCMQRKPM